jgi:curved DNA-binding protein CbpA
MEPTDNPYAILGVSPGASARDIRSAYRKAALLHHPDKKTDFQEKQEAHEHFAKISAAYELLTSPDYPMDSSTSNMHPPHTRSRQSYPSRFHDPFEVFEHVFREEFGNGDMRNPGPFGRSKDSLFREPFFGRGSPHRSIFDTGDPFGDDFSPSFGRPFGRSSLFESSLFGRDDQGDIFSSMREQMRKLEEQARFGEGDSNENQNKRIFTSSSSSTRSVRQANGDTVTTTKRTQTVNGKTEQVEETVVYGADGSVKERKITGNDSLLENSRSASHLLPNSQQQDRERAPPPSSWWRRKAIKPDHSDQERSSRL